jgi:hypothetical protein
MRTVAGRALVILALIAVFGAVTYAQEVTNLRVSRTDDGLQAAQVFPTGVEKLYAVFAYSDLSNQEVTVVVEGRGITDLYRTGTHFTGTGRGSLELSGGMFYKSVTNRLYQEARVAQEKVNAATTATFGLQEYLDQALGAVYSMEWLSAYLADVPISDPALEQTTTVRRSIAELERLLTEARSLPAADVAGRQAKAQEMKRPAASAVTASRQLQEGAASVTTAPIATSPKGMEYTVQLEIDGLPSSSVDFVVTPSTRIFLPSLSRHFARQ